MAIAEIARTRAPRGTKQVITAFFVALGEVPEAQRGPVGKAALVAIRDEMKTQRDKAKVAAARAKTKATATRDRAAGKLRATPKAADPIAAKRKPRVATATV